MSLQAYLDVQGPGLGQGDECVILTTIPAKEQACDGRCTGVGGNQHFVVVHTHLTCR